METMGNSEEKLTIKQLLKSHERLQEVLKACKINASIDWDNHFGIPPQEEFKLIVDIIEGTNNAK